MKFKYTDNIPHLVSESSTHFTLNKMRATFLGGHSKVTITKTNDVQYLKVCQFGPSVYHQSHTVTSRVTISSLQYVRHLYH